MKDDRWPALTLKLQKTAYDKLRGRGMGAIKITLLFIDGELTNWSDAETSCYGPFHTSADLVEFLNKEPTT